MRDLLVTLASIRKVPLWTHFYVFCFLFSFLCLLILSLFLFVVLICYFYNLCWLLFGLSTFFQSGHACSRRSIRKTERGGKQCYIRSGVKKKKKKKNVLFMRRLDPGFFLIFGPLQLSNCLMQTVVLRSLSST